MLITTRACLYLVVDGAHEQRHPRVDGHAQEVVGGRAPVVPLRAPQQRSQLRTEGLCVLVFVASIRLLYIGLLGLLLGRSAAHRTEGLCVLVIVANYTFIRLLYGVARAIIRGR